jgi:hypothetical protein
MVYGGVYSLSTAGHFTASGPTAGTLALATAGHLIITSIIDVIVSRFLTVALTDGTVTIELTGRG